jgi:hypothetical protein
MRLGRKNSGCSFNETKTQYQLRMILMFHVEQKYFPNKGGIHGVNLE